MAQVLIRNLNKMYGDVHAVKDVNLEIRDNEFLVLVGPSGCGKTTTLRMVAGLESITSGQIMIDDVKVNDLPPMDRDIAKRVQEAADILGIGDYLKRKPRQLSGGQRQRVALGRAIVRHPKVFLFDEPLSNLDAKLRVQMRVELKKLHTRLSTTAIYVTHDQVEAMTLGDRVVVMKDGLVQQVGEPLELYHTPANRFVAGFLGSPAMNFAAVRVHEADGALHAGSEGFRIDIPAEIGPRLRSYAGRDVTLGIRPEDLQLANGSHPPGLCFEAVVELVERLGAESLLDLQVGRQTMVASVEPTVRAQRGEKLRFAMRPERVHFFDAASEKAI